MIYTVVWAPDALQELAQIWIQADDRNEVEKAANSIDHFLKYDPHRIGHPVNGQFESTISPLCILYTINDGDRLVRVDQVLA